MIKLQRFFGHFGLPAGFLELLDRNFTEVSKEQEVYGVNDTYTMRASDQVGSLQVDASAAAVTVYLPEQPVGNRRRTITKIDSSANAVTVDGNGNNIVGSGTYSLAAQYDSVTVEATGTEWVVVAFYP